MCGSFCIFGPLLRPFTAGYVSVSRIRTFKNRILKRIFGPMRDENRAHNEELHSLYRLLNMLRVNNSRRLRWAGYVARMEDGRRAFKILTGKPTGKRPLGRLGVDGRTILEWTLKI